MLQIRPARPSSARTPFPSAVSRHRPRLLRSYRPATNTIGGFRAHVYLTFLVLALTTAFRCWLQAQDQRARQGKPLTDPDAGIRKFREQVREENANLVIVFHDERYALFETYEIAILLGRRVLKPRGVPETITPEDILRKYGVSRE